MSVNFVKNKILEVFNPVDKVALPAALRKYLKSLSDVADFEGSLNWYKCLEGLAFEPLSKKFNQDMVKEAQEFLQKSWAKHIVKKLNSSITAEYVSPETLNLELLDIKNLPETYGSTAISNVTVKSGNVLARCLLAFSGDDSDPKYQKYVTTAITDIKEAYNNWICGIAQNFTYENGESRVNAATIDSCPVSITFMQDDTGAIFDVKNSEKMETLSDILNARGEDLFSSSTAKFRSALYRVLLKDVLISVDNSITETMLSHTVKSVGGREDLVHTVWAKIYKSKNSIEKEDLYTELDRPTYTQKNKDFVDSVISTFPDIYETVINQGSKYSEINSKFIADCGLDIASIIHAQGSGSNKEGYADLSAKFVKSIFDITNATGLVDTIFNFITSKRKSVDDSDALHRGIRKVAEAQGDTQDIDNKLTALGGNRYDASFIDQILGTFDKYSTAKFNHAYMYLLMFAASFLGDKLTKFTPRDVSKALVNEVKTGTDEARVNECKVLLSLLFILYKKGFDLSAITLKNTGFESAVEEAKAKVKNIWKKICNDQDVADTELEDPMVSAVISPVWSKFVKKVFAANKSSLSSRVGFTNMEKYVATPTIALIKTFVEDFRSAIELKALSSSHINPDGLMSDMENLFLQEVDKIKVKEDKKNKIVDTPPVNKVDFNPIP